MPQNGPRRKRRQYAGNGDDGAKSPDDVDDRQITGGSDEDPEAVERGDDGPLVPVGVIKGINNVADEETADADEIEDVLRF